MKNTETVKQITEAQYNNLLNRLYVMENNGANWMEPYWWETSEEEIIEELEEELGEDNFSENDIQNKLLESETDFYENIIINDQYDSLMDLLDYINEEIDCTPETYNTCNGSGDFVYCAYVFNVDGKKKKIRVTLNAYVSEDESYCNRTEYNKNFILYTYIQEIEEEEATTIDNSI